MNARALVQRDELVRSLLDAVVQKGPGAVLVDDEPRLDRFAERRFEGLFGSAAGCAQHPVRRGASEASQLLEALARGG